ncbi:MAG: MurR/RpiR family transcriptional regulator [Ruminococcaceae bacterium]|nr:MurR/RpiR family transcriptional regulator [Oscillospiraceae bacterium]
MIGTALDRINAAQEIATKSEKKIIDGILNIAPEEIIYLSISDLASRLKVADATLVRFCKKLGYNGFQDFKLHLSQSVGAAERQLSNCQSKRIALQMIDAINETARSVDYAEYLKIADLMIASEKKFAFGVGNSAITAMEISNVFSRMGMLVHYTPDPHLQAMITSNLTPQDTVILISVSGSTKDIIDVAEIAKKNGANIVVITCYDRSPLAKYADHILLSTRREAAYEGGSVSTIVSISYIINLLYNAIYEKLGDDGYNFTMRSAKSVANKSL